MTGAEQRCSMTGGRPSPTGSRDSAAKRLLERERIWPSGSQIQFNHTWQQSHSPNLPPFRHTAGELAVVMALAAPMRSMQPCDLSSVAAFSPAATGDYPLLDEYASHGGVFRSLNAFRLGYPEGSDGTKSARAAFLAAADFGPKSAISVFQKPGQQEYWIPTSHIKHALDINNITASANTLASTRAADGGRSAVGRRSLALARSRHVCRVSFVCCESR